MPKASLSADVVLPGRLELCLALYFIPMVVTIFCYWYFMHSMLSLLESHGAGHCDPLQVPSLFGDLQCVSCDGVLPDEKSNLAGV